MIRAKIHEHHSAFMRRDRWGKDLIGLGSILFDNIVRYHGFAPAWCILY